MSGPASDASDPICFAGLDGDSGRPLYGPLASSEAVELACRLPPDRQRTTEAARVATEKRTPGLGPRYGIDPKDLGQTGWGVVFAHDADPAVIDALSPLLTHRQAQAAAVNERFFRRFEGEHGLRQGEDKLTFLKRHGMGPGAADPRKMPYYLLLVGAPEAVSWELQQALAVQYAVGRVAFDTPEDYARYAESVVAAETRAQPRAREVTFFAVQNPDDTATRLMSQYLVATLPGRLETERGEAGWKVRTVGGELANKPGLARLLGGEETPALLFTTSHGMGFGKGSPRQRRHQGALVCDEWKGTVQSPGPISEAAYFSADDLTSDAAPRGLVAFHYACHGAGLPRFDQYPERSGASREVAEKPFVARLPQRLLAAERGGALAVIGHVERAFCWSFLWDEAGGQTQIFEDTLLRLLDGFPVGAAFEPFTLRFADLATLLLEATKDRRLAAPGSETLSDRDLTRLWTAYRDAQSYAILGDPAVRLAV